VKLERETVQEAGKATYSQNGVEYGGTERLLPEKAQEAPHDTKFLRLAPQPVNLKTKPLGIGINFVVGLAKVINPQEAGLEPAVYKWEILGRAIYVD
jgi:hypothetical protein